MKLKILLFARLREICGAKFILVDSPRPLNIVELKAGILNSNCELGPWLGCCVISVNGQLADAETWFKESDEIALIPPASGGNSICVSFCRGIIDHSDVLENLNDPLNGGVVVFFGNVRTMTGENFTEKLHYQSYEPMAAGMLNQIAILATKLFNLGQVKIIHRLGDVMPGESSVAIAVSSPHRADAFNGCSWIMDRIKESVPIWKLDFRPDGTCKWGHPGSPEDTLSQ
jgi:molybdopterin synthase catalytic subunit